MKTGIIDVGGGLRGIYAAGVLDFCIKKEISFDYCIGISAGSANLTSYLAQQYQRNYKFYREYSFRKEYMGFRTWLHTGSFIDMDYVYGTLSNSTGEYPLDYPKIKESSAELFIVATEAVTGKPKYFTKNDIGPDDYRILMASSSIPGVNRPYEINGVFYYDGAVGNPIPLTKAFEDGCDRVVLLLTKPVSTIRSPKKDCRLAKLIRRKYPQTAKQLCLRAQHYNTAVALANKYEKEGKVLIIAPDNTAGVDTLSKNKAALEQLYQKGFSDGKKILSWFQNNSDENDDDKKFSR